MPVNKDALRRYRVIDKALSDPNRDYTTDDILTLVNRECNKVSLRMIQKDIKAIEEEFGKRIVRNAGRRGTVRYEDQSTPLFYQELTLEEAEMLKEVLHSLGHFDGLDDFIWLDLLRKRLDVTEPERNIPLMAFSKNEGLQIPATLLARLFAAIVRKQVIRLTYTPFGKTSRQFTVHPYQLRQYNDRWFLICSILATPEYPYDPKFILDLALDRIDEDFAYVEDEEYIECVVDLKARYDEIVGITLLMENDVEDIYFAVDDMSLDYVRTKWLHTSQIELDEYSQTYFKEKYPTLSDWTFFSIECRENRELYARFASYMDNIVVVEPAPLRERMQKVMNRAFNNYMSLDSGLSPDTTV